MFQSHSFVHFSLFLLLSLLCACETDPAANSGQQEQLQTGPLFELISPEYSGIDFVNRLKETDQLNYFTYEYLYNGGGVAVGDVNQDGLPDLYFTGNMVPNRLYLNNGNCQFTDITKIAQVSYVNDWCTGVSFVDINADGQLDIYVCASGWYEADNNRRNQLFVNKGLNKGGIPIFEDQAAAYGLDDPAYSTQAAFFDYDRDGDLDMYLANHPRKFQMHIDDFKAKSADPPTNESDKLFRNDGGRFTDVSREAGIQNFAHSLGVVALDYDRDGWTDIYVSNDFQGSDMLYRNLGNGRFENMLFEATGHTARSSMGVDAGDFDGDGYPDVFAVEMVSAENKRQKTNMAPMNPAEFQAILDHGLGYQYMHNCLQWNRGNGKFSEIAFQSGLAYTDWSWAPLFADFDNDGRQDVFVSNGFRRDVLDKDFVKTLKKKHQEGKVRFEDLRTLIPQSKQANYLYQNKGGLLFENKQQAWGLSHQVNTNGAMYADLDLDGDLDLILNNIDEEALIYRNLGQEQDRGHFLQVAFEGPPGNFWGIGTEVSLQSSSGSQYQQLQLSRGFQSAGEAVLHFGLGTAAQIQSLTVIWPDGKQQELQNVAADQRLVLKYREASVPSDFPILANTHPFFTGRSDLVKHQHRERPFDDYSKQVLLPHKLSQYGPALSVGDINGDGLEDVFIGGAAGKAASLFVQKAAGTFVPQHVPVLEKDRNYEDVASCLLDVEGDGDLDLYIVSGSYEFGIKDSWQSDRLYLNEGNGQFKRKAGLIPDIRTSGSCVKPADFDGDGDLDLFVGGRLVPGKYPMAPRSYLLQNDHGSFSDITTQKAAELAQIGMVTDALWMDTDGDSDLDLWVVGEWMKPTLFLNEGGKLARTNPPGTEMLGGWWNCISVLDADQDGDPDLLLGNLGLNSKNKASQNYPFQVYAHDFDGSGSMDIVLGYYNNGVQYPVRGLQCSSEQLPSLAEQIPSYDLFGSLNLEGIYGQEKLEQAMYLEVQEFRSGWLEQKAGNQWAFHPFPPAAQIAPVNAFLSVDLEGDRCPDILLAGNQLEVEVETGRYDAHMGLILTNDCHGTFESLGPVRTGLNLTGEVRHIQRIKLAADPSKVAFIAVQNQGATIVYESSFHH